MIPGLDAWLTTPPDEVEDRSMRPEEESREDEEPDICGQFYDGY